jgi:diaminopimelate epimerase
MNFTKMHGLGNDFIVIDNINNAVNLDAKTIKKLADRHFGIGFDQLLMVEKSSVAEFKYRIFNADGSEVEQCGNGARCFAKFVLDKKLTSNNPIVVETKGGIISLLKNGENIEVDMGIASFNPKTIIKNKEQKDFL